MTRSAYYNEIDQFSAVWLKNLIAEGLIANGEVDTRSIVDVRPAELRGYAQCHFFAGIGGWSLALRLAGWPDEQPVWTGSCPCQPFSTAGYNGGFADERHLWPAFHGLIRECGPQVVFGEQVASLAGLGWLDLVQSDLERSGYASAAVDMCAAGVGAPHIRQRLWWVAERMEYATRNGWEQRWAEPSGRSAVGGCGVGGMANTHHTRLEIGRCGPDEIPRQKGREAAQRPAGLCRLDGRLADLHGGGRLPGGIAPASTRHGHPIIADGGISRPDAAHGGWGNPDWLHCRDDKWRPDEPGTFPLAHGIPARVGRLRAYGNAIVPQVAAEFVGAVMDCRPALEPAA